MNIVACTLAESPKTALSFEVLQSFRYLLEPLRVLPARATLAEQDLEARTCAKPRKASGNSRRYLHQSECKSAQQGTCGSAPPDKSRLERRSEFGPEGSVAHHLQAGMC